MLISLISTLKSLNSDSIFFNYWFGTGITPHNTLLPTRSQGQTRLPDQRRLCSVSNAAVYLSPPPLTPPPLPLPRRGRPGGGHLPLAESGRHGNAPHRPRDVAAVARGRGQPSGVHVRLSFETVRNVTFVMPTMLNKPCIMYIPTYIRLYICVVGISYAQGSRIRLLGLLHLQC